MLSQSRFLEFLIVQSISYSKLYSPFSAWLDYKSVCHFLFRQSMCSFLPNESYLEIQYCFSLTPFSVVNFVQELSFPRPLNYNLSISK